MRKWDFVVKNSPRVVIFYIFNSVKSLLLQQLTYSDVYDVVCLCETWLNNLILRVRYNQTMDLFTDVPELAELVEIVIPEAEQTKTKHSRVGEQKPAG